MLQFCFVKKNDSNTRPSPQKRKKKKTHPITGKYNKTKKQGKALKVTPHTNCSTTLIFWLNIICAFSLENKQNTQKVSTLF